MRRYRIVRNGLGEYFVEYEFGNSAYPWWEQIPDLSFKSMKDAEWWIKTQRLKAQKEVVKTYEA